MPNRKRLFSFIMVCSPFLIMICANPWMAHGGSADRGLNPLWNVRLQASAPQWDMLLYVMEMIKVIRLPAAINGTKGRESLFVLPLSLHKMIRAAQADSRAASIRIPSIR